MDSNTAIYYLQGNARVISLVESHTIHFLPFMTVAELLYGAKRSARPADNLRVYLEFISRFSVLYPGRQTLETYSDLRVALRASGRPIPPNDVWQAALALEYEAILVTNDRHFAAVPGLRSENWAV